MTQRSARTIRSAHVMLRAQSRCDYLKLGSKYAQLKLTKPFKSIMATMLGLLSEEEITQILKRAKYMEGDLDWDEKPNNGTYLMVRRNLMDENGATIPGLSAEMRFRRGR